MSDLLGSWALKHECEGCGFHSSKRAAAGEFERGERAKEVRAADVAGVCLD